MTLPEFHVDETSITYPGADGFTIRALLCQPQIRGLLPGIVIAHEMYGLTEHIAVTARRLASNGYVVLAPDLFSRGGGPGWPPVKERIALVGDYPDWCATADLEGALDTLRANPRVSSDQIGCLGFSFGARYSLFACSRRHDVKAAVIFYAVLFYKKLTKNRVRQPLTTIQDIRCPALYLYGDQDALVAPFELDQLGALTNLYGSMCEYHRYTQAGHGFFNDTLKTYDQDVAADAWRRTLNFFNRHLTSQVARK